MGLKITTDDKGVMIFRQDKTSQSGTPYTQYSMGVSSKDTNGEWVNGFVECGFKKGVEVPNKSKISINNAFYTVNEYNSKKYYKVMITDFNILESGQAAPVAPADGFVNVPDGIDEDLPFAMPTR